MPSGTLQRIAAALLLLFVSTYCAAECVVAPCHDVQAASDTNVPPCHRQSQQQPQNDSSERCLHPQFVVDAQQTVSVLPMMMVQHAVLVPAELVLPDALSGSFVVASVEISPPPLPVLDLSTVLRV